MTKIIAVVAILAASLRADALTDIVGPVTANGTSPWPYYDIAEQANADQVAPAALAFPPLAGSAISCVVTMNNTAPITLTAASSGCAAEVAPVSIVGSTAANPTVITLVATAPSWLVVGQTVSVQGASGCSGINDNLLINAVSGSTLTVAHDCTGGGASGGAIHDQILIATNTVDGTGAGRFYQYVQSVSASTITPANGSGMVSTLSSTTLTGLTVYHCARCDGDIGSPYAYYSIGNWGLAGALNGSPATFYDTPLALYREYLRTADAAYLTSFRQTADTWWTHAINSGQRSLDINPARAFNLTSQFVRALDGQSQRFPVLFAMIKNTVDNNVSAWPNGEDNREPGYMLLFTAVGARADPDPTRHSYYCSTAGQMAGTWLTLQNMAGFWSEKNSQYPYDVYGTSPWRQFAVMQGLARAYDVLADTSAAGCNNPSLAAQILTALEAAGEYEFSAGLDTAARGVYYDIDHQVDGLQGHDNYGQQSGSCNVAVGDTTLACSGTAFLSQYSVGQWIGILDNCGSQFPTCNQGNNFVHRITAIADDTHLTFSGAWGTQCITGFGRGTGYPPVIQTDCELSIMTGSSLWKADPASSACNSTASYCLSPGNPDSNRDMVWIMGWLLKTTGTPKWKTYGDALFSRSAGGPADGPGGVLPCAGPNCSSTPTDYELALGGCAIISPPCTNQANYQNPGPVAMNPYLFGGKRWAQGSGIGGADNYLYWRQATIPPVQSVSTSGGIFISGGVH